MDNSTVVNVLNKSKTDFTLEDFYHIFEEKEELLDFLEEYDYEVRDLLSLVLPEVMNRLKIRMAFASAGEDDK